MKTIGVIGVGNMGLPMVKALRRAGFDVVARDLRPVAEAAAVAAGARLAASARDLAAHCEMILVVVVDAGEIEDALFREAGPAAAGWQAGTVVALCSTIAQDDAGRLAARIESAGAAALDAPISGGPLRAEQGQLSLMLAGAEAVLARAEPVLAVLADKRFRISARPGDGARMKLVNNLLAGINLAAGAEVLAMGQRLGLDPELMLAVIGASSGQSWIVAERMPRAFAGDFAPRAHARILHKDIGLGLAMAAAAGCDANFGARAGAVCRNSAARLGRRGRCRAAEDRTGEDRRTRFGRKFGLRPGQQPRQRAGGASLISGVMRVFSPSTISHSSPSCSVHCSCMPRFASAASARESSGDRLMTVRLSWRCRAALFCCHHISATRPP